MLSENGWMSRLFERPIGSVGGLICRNGSGGRCEKIIRQMEKPRITLHSRNRDFGLIGGAKMGCLDFATGGVDFVFRLLSRTAKTSDLRNVYSG